MVVVAEEGENLNSAPATMRKREGGTVPASRSRKFHPFFGRKRYENRRHLIPKRRGEWGGLFFLGNISRSLLRGEGRKGCLQKSPF